MHSPWQYTAAARDRLQVKWVKKQSNRLNGVLRIQVPCGPRQAKPNSCARVHGTRTGSSDGRATKGLEAKTSWPLASNAHVCQCTQEESVALPIFVNIPAEGLEPRFSPMLM
jgi:hypothetical protein